MAIDGGGRERPADAGLLVWGGKPKQKNSKLNVESRSGSRRVEEWKRGCTRKHDQLKSEFRDHQTLPDAHRHIHTYVFSIHSSFLLSFHHHIPSFFHNGALSPPAGSIISHASTLRWRLNIVSWSNTFPHPFILVISRLSRPIIIFTPFLACTVFRPRRTPQLLLYQPL